MSKSGLKQRVESMIARLGREDVCMHGFILSVAGKEKATAYYAPFDEGQPHRMYSVSKTLTGIAVGMLMGEGRLKPDDHIAGFFADLLPDKPDERLMRLTIADMLRMATYHSATAYRKDVDEDWTKPFFTVKPTHEPGTVFCYDTGCSQVLAALVRRLSGLSVMDFLSERFFEKIGATDEKRWLTDPSGECQGGTGLIMSLRDLHKAASVIMRGGDGIVPRWYCEEMVKPHISTVMQSKPEERCGYGWQCWRTRAGYAMYGMGGQLAICCPEKDALLCTIADTRLDAMGVQRIYDAFFDEVYPYIGAEDMSPCRWELEVNAVESLPEFEIADTGVYRFDENPLGIRRLSLKGNALTLENRHGLGELRFGLGGNIAGSFPGHEDVPALCSGGYIGKGMLRVRCYAIGDAPCGVDMLLAFTGNCVTVMSRRSVDPVTEGFEGVASGYLEG